MSEKFKITIDDVRRFLRTIVGLKWDNMVITDHGKKPASKLSDLALKRGNPATIEAIDRSGNSNIVNIGVSPIYFATYVESFDYSDIDEVLTFIVEHDLSKQWITFLKQEYGREYQDYASEFCKHEKSRLVLNTYDKVEKLDAEKRDILKEHGKQLAKYTNIEKFIYGNEATNTLNNK